MQRHEDGAEIGAAEIERDVAAGLFAVAAARHKGREHLERARAASKALSHLGQKAIATKHASIVFNKPHSACIHARVKPRRGHRKLLLQRV